MISRRVAYSLGGGATVGAALVLAMGPFVRGHVSSRAQEVGLSAEIGSAVPGFSGLRLRAVSLELEGVSGLRVWCEEALVPWGARRPSEVSGVRVVAVGSQERLTREVMAWRGRWWPLREQGVGEGGEGTSGWPKLEAVVLDWRAGTADSEDRLHVAGGVVERGHTEGVSVSFDTLRGQFHGLSLAVDGAHLQATRADDSWRVQRLETESLVVATAEAAGHSASDATSSAESPRPLASSSSPQSGAEVASDVPRTAAQAVSSGDAAGAGLSAMWGRLRSLGSLAREVASSVDARLASQPTVELRGVRANVHVFGQPLALGPGSLRLKRSGAALDVELEPTRGKASFQDQRPLALRASVPLQAHDAQAKDAPVRFEVAGGPIAVAQFGLRNGDLGLSNVEHATLTSDASLAIDDASDTVTIAGSGTIRGLAVQHAKLAASALEGLQLGWRGRFVARLDGSEVRVEAGEFDFGQLKWLVSGTYRRRSDAKADANEWQRTAIDFRFELPLTNCQSAFDSLPRALVPKLAGTTFAGSLSMKGHVRFDGAALAKTYDVDWDGAQSCRVLEVPDHLRVDRFRQPFEKVVYTPEGQEKSQTFGPGTPSWVPFAAMSPFLETGVLLCEDGRFRRHHGFDKEAIVNSLRENLLAGAFRRGASTISMQLAKNLFLTREKVLSRKVQEAILTLYLEQVLTKEELLELYFNVIEYGPMVYGIGPAAQYHFATTAKDLSLAQSLYLASILQNPKKQYYGANGVVSPQRMEYLQRLMRMGAKLRLIREPDLAAGLEETLAFGKPAASTPSSDTDSESESVGQPPTVPAAVEPPPAP